mmetsp:Transcript_92078/g.257192  ORF Transcript_92078/g.257192 Transcript_92078/m.257192 type:complete len:213 (+) Transcript_92078:654-1292(+)
MLFEATVCCWPACKMRWTLLASSMTTKAIPPGRIRHVPGRTIFLDCVVSTFMTGPKPEKCSVSASVHVQLRDVTPRTMITRLGSSWPKLLKQLVIVPSWRAVPMSKLNSSAPSEVPLLPGSARPSPVRQATAQRKCGQAAGASAAAPASWLPGEVAAAAGPANCPGGLMGWPAVAGASAGACMPGAPPRRPGWAMSWLPWTPSGLGQSSGPW